MPPSHHLKTPASARKSTLMLRVPATLTLAGSLVVLSACSSAAPNAYSVPDFEGAGVASAQNSVQKETAGQATVVATDLSEDNRKVTSTNEWKICTQSVANGEDVARSTELQLGVVRADEDCPKTGVVANVATLKKELTQKANDAAEPDPNVVADLAKKNGMIDWTNTAYVGKNETDRSVNEIQEKLEVPVTGSWDHASSEETFRLKGAYKIAPDGDWTADIDAIVFP